MKIGLDFGGVIANHQTRKLELAQQMGFDVLKESDVVRGVLVPKIGQEKYDELVEQTTKDTQNFPLTSGLCEAIAQLNELGHTTHVVSTQASVTEADLHTYLSRHGVNVTTLDVVTEDGGKLAVCKKRGVDVFLDDSLSVLRGLQELSIPLFLAQFMGSYDLEPSPGITVVASWNEFIEHINKLSV